MSYSDAIPMVRKLAGKHYEMEEKARVSYSPSNKNLIQLPYHFLKIDHLSNFLRFFWPKKVMVK